MHALQSPTDSISKSRSDNCLETTTTSIWFQAFVVVDPLRASTCGLNTKFAIRNDVTQRNINDSEYKFYNRTITGSVYHTDVCPSSLTPGGRVLFYACGFVRMWVRAPKWSDLLHVGPKDQKIGDDPLVTTPRRQPPYQK